MVVSRLNPEINYRDITAGSLGPIASTDRAHRSALYELRLPISGKRKYLIAVGKARFEYSVAYGIIYLYIYLVKRGRVIGSIGIYEYDKHDFTTQFDAQKDLIIDKREPLLYPAITLDLLESVRAEMDEEDLEDPEDKKQPQQPSDDSDSEEDDTFTKVLPKEKEKDSENNQKRQEREREKDKDQTKDVDTLTRDTMFKIDYPAPKRTDIENSTDKSIETQRSEAKRARDEYATTEHTSSADNWIQKIMRSKYYQIHDNDGAGDCLFHVIVEAYREIGYHTTVAKLRQLLSQKTNRDHFDNLRTIYAGIAGQIEQTEQEIKKLETNFKLLRSQAGVKKNKADTAAIIKAGTENRQELKKQQENLASARELIVDFNYMKHITTLDEFRQYVRTSACWADAWSIDILEQELAMKFIIFKDSRDKDDIIQCSNTPKDISTVRNPKHYILVEFFGENHYRLVSYRGHKIFAFSEISFDVKMLIVNKCMERSAGAFHIIPEFRQFQESLGIDEATIIQSATNAPEKPTGQDNDESVDMADLYEDAVVFRFHADSDETKKPGDVNGEKLPKKRVGEFADLNTRKNWRQQLDDDWSNAPFTLDSDIPTNGSKKKLRWASVTHYIHAAPLAEIDADAYTAFSLDSGSALSKSVAAAKESVLKKGKKEGKYYAKVEKLRNDDLTAFERQTNDARKRALFAKFTQNADLTTTLNMTKKAQLLHFVRGQPPESDTLLMLVRRKLV